MTIWLLALRSCVVTAVELRLCFGAENSIGILQIAK
jgi:hypothetical protein